MSSYGYALSPPSANLYISQFLLLKCLLFLMQTIFEPKLVSHLVQDCNVM